MSANRVSLEVEVDVHVFTKATRVVVSVRLGVTKRLQDAVRLQQDVLHSVQHASIPTGNTGNYREFPLENYCMFPPPIIFASIVRPMNALQLCR